MAIHPRLFSLMLRYIAGLLLVGNLGVLVWGMSREPPAAVPQIAETLLGEDAVYLWSEQSQGRAGDEFASVISDPVRVSSGSSLCKALGPFDDVIEGRRVLGRLAALGLSFTLTAIDRDVGDQDFRVLLPPFGTRSEAFRQLRELKRRGIDSHIIDDGRYAPGISLGLFPSQADAERLAAHRAQQGYNAEVVAIKRLQRTHWAMPKAGVDVESVALDELEMRADVAWSDQPCDS